MARAWTFQRPKQVVEQGEERAPWYVGWYEPGGSRKSKSCGPGPAGKRLAEKERDRIAAELITETYDRPDNARKSWKAFRLEYEEVALAGLSPDTRTLYLTTLEHFCRIVKPGRVSTITTHDIDRFIAARLKERGHKPDSTTAPATVNKDLRHLKAALTKAVKWGYLARLPEITFVKAPKKLVRFMSSEHFGLIYHACDQARFPLRLEVSPPDWWRALLVAISLTGWRIGDMLALRRDQVDLERGTACVLAEDTKGDRDDAVRLHAAVLEHLARLPIEKGGAGNLVFPWPHPEKTLYEQFHALQASAGIKLVCRHKHEHTPTCHVYGFHDLRRAFATLNAANLSAEALQRLMRHRSYATTQLYINAAFQVADAVDSLHVPEVLRQPGSQRGSKMEAQATPEGDNSP